MPPTSAIEAHGLRKVFDEKVAVANLTLSVEQGEVFGFLGPNGAGKTTAVKMLLGLIRPTSGEGFLLGAPLRNQAARSRVGFLPEHVRFHDWLKGSEFLALHAELYKMRGQQARRRIADLLDLVSLTPHAGKKLREYSKGMLQRIGLAQALLNQPEVTGGGARNKEDLMRGLAMAEEALQISQQLGDKYREMYSLGTLATIYSNLGDTRWEEYGVRGLEIARQLGDVKSEVKVFIWDRIGAVDG